ncbi:MAG: molybdenum ABC transporter ATP-binding protein [Oceanobacter sp.]
MALTTDSTITDSGLQARLQLQRPEFELNVELNLPDSGVSVLFGHSGSGKTTLLRCLAGLERAQGTVRFRQHHWQTERHWLPTHQRPLAYVFQEASLFSHLTANGNLAFAIRRANTPVAQSQRDHIIDLLGIRHTLARYPHQLSGGERQRVAIARALLNQPQLLLMDEPLASLDEQRKQEILPYLEQLRSELALPILYVTHSITEVSRLADHLIALEQGRIVAQGTLNDTLGHPAFPIGLGEEAGVVLEGTVHSIDERWQLASLRIDDQHTLWLRNNHYRPGQTLRTRVLARDISLSNNRPADTSILNIWPGTLTAIHSDPHPAMALLQLHAGDIPLLARITRRSLEQLHAQPGQTLWIQVKAAALA